MGIPDFGETIIATDNEDALSPIPLLVRVLDDVEQLPSLDVENDLLERYPAFRLQPSILLVVPGVVLHGSNIHHCVPFVNRLVIVVYGYCKVGILTQCARGRSPDPARAMGVADSLSMDNATPLYRG